MAISSMKTGLIKRSLLVGNTAFNPSSYESIASVTVGSGGATSITFSSIPATYTHLQIRSLYCNATANAFLKITTSGGVNTGAKGHMLNGNGTTAQAFNYDPLTNGIYIDYFGPSSTTSFYGSVIDILDYANTNKNKTVRGLGGVDVNGSGEVFLFSSLYTTTNAITDLTISGAFLKQYSSFALYGIKGS